MRKDKNRKGLLRQAGVTLMEMAVVVTVGAVLTIAGFRGAEYLTRSNAAQNIANQAQIGYDVLNNYVAQNVDALVNGQPVAGVAVPLAPTPTELVALGYRNFSVSSTIPDAQWTYSMALSPAGCTPNTCNVAVYFGLTAPPRTRDNAADIALIADAAIRSARPAGWSTIEVPGNIVGIGAQFNIANPQGATPGILGLYGSYGAGQFGNYVRMGDTRSVTLNSALSVQGNTTVGGGVTASGTVRGSTVQSTGNVVAAGTVQGGNVHSTGNITATGNVAANYVTSNYGGLRSYQSADWGVILGAAGGALTAGAGSHVGSMHVNDIYLRSRGQWMSSVATRNPQGCYWTGQANLWGGGQVHCADGYYMKGWYGPYYHMDTNIAQLYCCGL